MTESWRSPLEAGSKASRMRKAMRGAIEGTYTYLEIAACGVAFLPIMGAVRLLHRNDDVPRARGWWMRKFGRTTSALTPLWKFDVQGEAPADIKTRAYVVVSNHMSNADPFLLSWLPWDMQWVSKEELFRLPLFGLLLKLGGDISVRRGEGESVRAMLAQCRFALKHGLSLMIFPEGSRTHEGGVRVFKDTAFQLAIEEQAPVLPLAVAGTRGCMPKGARWFGRAHAITRVLEPIETRGLTLDDLPRVRELARERVTAGVKALEAELEAELRAER
jgi:1-acyl-sn-glycerol-3-phosphate acyltransferase